ncbi:MAG: hypothetical protein KBG54_05880 [Oscillospiraceae bacterium]|jgi:hypothetical protein|nr:hypothetical protein [Oscillospiraceae bacterium]
MLFPTWLIIGAVAFALVLGVLVLAAVRGARSKPSAPSPTQQTGNPYRSFYSKKK